MTKIALDEKYKSRPQRNTLVACATNYKNSLLDLMFLFLCLANSLNKPCKDVAKCINKIFC